MQPPPLAFIIHTSGLALPQHGYIIVLSLQNAISSPSPSWLLLPRETDTGERRKKAGSRKKTPEDFSELAPRMIIQIQVLRPPRPAEVPIIFTERKMTYPQRSPRARVGVPEGAGRWSLLEAVPPRLPSCFGAGNQCCDLEHFLQPTSRPHSLVLH